MLTRAARWMMAAVAIAFAYVAYVFVTLPDVRLLRTVNPQTTAFMELRAREARDAGRTPRKVQTWVSYERISPSLKRAVLVAEDAAFFQHEGIDFDELEKSFEENWKQGKLARGGSTITQQLAKNLYLSPSRNPMRKVTEFLIARRLEAELSKRRILEIYLNVIEWGDGIWGAEAAARSYFRTPASALGPGNAALLAAAIINPRRYNPAHPSGFLVRRQQLILQRMGEVEPPAPAATPPGSAPGDAALLESASPSNEPPAAAPARSPGDPAPGTTPQAGKPGGLGGPS
ncbi:MAG: monofunctional biosynthetic peptidoglycan transglycosylase [Acidobacteria bacterium]|nr:monofunctional biosynthetic peptidoglycan transglycosylase [Acidobacteriota bacterium]